MEPLPHNGLTPAQAERLAVLVEEMGEAIQAAGKVLRFGWDSRCHGDPASPSGRERLQAELGDVACAVDLLCFAGDVSRYKVIDATNSRHGRVAKHMHHQDEPGPDE